MPNYELTPEGMTTGDKGIAAMFLGKEVIIGGMPDERILSLLGSIVTIPNDTTYFDSDDGAEWTHITIPYAALKSAIAPVEGEAFVEIGFGDIATDGLILYGANDTMTKPDVEKRLNWRVINICQDYGQLRELLAAIERCG